MSLRLMVALVFAVLLAVFAGQNADPVPVRFLRWEAAVPLVVITAVTVAAGALLVGILTTFRQVRQSLRMRERQAQIRRLEAELQSSQEARQRLESRIAALEAEIAQLRAAAGTEAAGEARVGQPGADS